MQVRGVRGLWPLAAVSALAAVNSVQAQYFEDWNKKIDQSALNDNGVDIAVTGENGKSYVAGWVTNSGSKTSWRLRVYAEDEGAILDSAAWDDGNTTALRYPHAMAIIDDSENTDTVQSTDIFITGESPVSGENKNIVTLKYVFNHSTDTLSGPTVAWYNNDAVDGHDIGWDIAAIPELGLVVVTGSSAGYGTGLDSVTICYDPSDMDEVWANPYRYNQGGATNRDDVTVSVSAGPFYEENTVVVAGYSRGSSNDDFLTISLDVDDGAVNRIWRKDTGNDERATAVTREDGGTGVFVTGWTVHATEADVPTTTDFMTLRYVNSSATEEWVDIYDGPDSGDDAAYTIEYWFDENAVYVGGESAADGESANYKVLRYEADDGTAPDWDKDADGNYNGSNNGADVGFELAVDTDGHVYITGYVTKTNNSIASLDIGTVRFIEGTGSPDSSTFAPFLYNGSANSTDWGAAIAVQGGQYGATNPDTFVTGVSTDTSESQNIRTIKYEYAPSE